MPIHKVGIFIDVTVRNKQLEPLLNHIRTTTNHILDIPNCQQIGDDSHIRFLCMIIGQGAYYDFIKTLSIENESGVYIDFTIPLEHVPVFLDFLKTEKDYTVDLPNCREINSVFRIRLTLDVGHQGKCLEFLSRVAKTLGIEGM